MALFGSPQFICKSRNAVNTIPESALACLCQWHSQKAKANGHKSTASCVYYVVARSSHSRSSLLSATYRCRFPNNPFQPILKSIWSAERETTHRTHHFSTRVTGFYDDVLNYFDANARRLIEIISIMRKYKNCECGAYTHWMRQPGIHSLAPPSEQCTFELSVYNIHIMLALA